MLDSIFGALTSAIANGLDVIVANLLTLLTFNMEQILEYMPIIAKMYDILQWVAIGLIVGIAAIQMSKFFFGALNESRDHPLSILVRSALAGALVYIGNYGLQMIFDLFSYPMTALMGVDASFAEDSFAHVAGEIDLVTAAIGLGGLLISLLVLLALGWNILKLLLEAVERWVVLCVLTYTSPLAYATVASRSTGEIFKKWFSMVIGQCILLLFNVWSIKLIVNIIGTMTNSRNLVFAIIVALALTRVAQNIDSYLQQIGINAATTGGSLLDTMMAVGTTAFGAHGKRSGGGHGVMGSWASAAGEAIKNGNVLKGAMYGGVAGAGAAAVKKAADAMGGTAGEYVRSKVRSGADKAQEFADSHAPGFGNAMRSAREFAGKGNAARETAVGAGMAAAEEAIRMGRTPEEAKQAAMSAYDQAIHDGAPLGTAKLFNHTSKNIDARNAFGNTLDESIPQMQNGASRMYMDNNGVLHDAFGDTIPNTAADVANAAGMAGASVPHAPAGAATPYTDAGMAGSAMRTAANVAGMAGAAASVANSASRVVSAAGSAAGTAAGLSAQAGATEVAMAAATMQGPNSAVARAIASSANSVAAESGVGFAPNIPNPNAYDENGELREGETAMVMSPGTKMSVDTINDRGEDVANEIVEGEFVVDNHAVAAAALSNSSYSETGFEDIDTALSAMDSAGAVPAAQEATDTAEAVPDRGVITDMSVGKGVAEFTFENPAERIPVQKEVDGQVVQTFEAADAKVERVTVRTAEAFKTLPASEQKLYRANHTASGATMYTRRRVIEPENFVVAQEHRSQMVYSERSGQAENKPHKNQRNNSRKNKK